MDMPEVSPKKSWTTRRERKKRRLMGVANHCDGRVIHTEKMIEAMEELLEPGDRVCLEGNNQKQADFLSRMLAQVDPARTHSLHLLISVLSRPEHMELFERKIASRVDFSFSGPQASRLAQMVTDNEIQIGAIHTYLDLFGRYLVDLTPDISLVAADSADEEGNLFTGANTEETPRRFPGESSVLAARQTWEATRVDAAMPRPPGWRCGRKQGNRLEDEGSLCNWCKLFARGCSRHL
jgi:malonate decarboxylase alpha subunit